MIVYRKKLSIAVEDGNSSPFDLKGPPLPYGNVGRACDIDELML